MNPNTKYKVGEHPSLPAPIRQAKLLGWLRKNLFSTWYDSLLTIIFLYLLGTIVPPALDWVLISADFYPANRNECTSGGACWGVVTRRFDQFLYGFYPSAEHWRANTFFALLAVAALPLLWDKVPYRRFFIMFTLAFPVLAYFLLFGGFGLPTVDTDKVGGLLLTVTLGVMGIAFSLPIGILLALGRRSEMPAVRFLCVLFIEFIRGVPMISLLFMATVLLPLFLPKGISVDQLLRVIFIVIMFASAYIAEVIRGGLQAIPKGQLEASQALGLNYWKTMTFIILPQALKISIPGIVNSFIGLFKDTTLVVIVGLFDLLGVGRAALANKEWIGLSNEVYVFIAVVFFVFCYSMARYSQYLEVKLATGHKL